MQQSVVNYNNLNHELRIDAEYYREEVLKQIELLEKKEKKVLSDLAFFIIGPFGSTVTVDQYVQHSKYRYIRNKDITDFQISDCDEPAYIPEHVYKSLPRFHIKENDLLITVVGTLGKVAIATSKDVTSIFSCKSTIIRVHKIDPFYLLAYLNSNIGQLFALRGVRGAIQQGLNLSDLKEIKVFVPTNKFQINIRNIVSKAFSYITEAKNLYKQSENILLSELNILKLKVNHQRTFIRNYSDTKLATRIDAEYFQPKYEEIIQAAKASGKYSCLGDIVSVKKSIEPGSESYRENGIVFLRVSNLSKYGFKDGNQQYLSKDLYKEVINHQPKKGEILLSKDATPGLAYYLKDDPSELIPSSGILRIKIKDENKLIPEYLTLVLNSIIVQKQIERDAGGSIINHWLVDQVKNTFIPILPIEKQRKISEKINESFCRRELSKQLLDIAKKGVEMAIEKNEEVAEKWINKEMVKRQD